MRKLWSVAKILLMLNVSVIAGPAFGQTSECSCVTPSSTGSGPAGQITAANGQVLSSQPTGLGPAQVGAGLLPGSQVITGPNSSAIVAVGSCTLSLEPNSELTVIDRGPDICLQIARAGDQAMGTINSVVFGTLLAGGAAGAASFAIEGEGGFELGGGGTPISR